MTQAKENILPSSEEMEVEMAILRCVYCGSERVIDNSGYYNRKVTSELLLDDTIRGYLSCGHCGLRTIFELQGKTLTFLPGRAVEENLTNDVDDNAREMFEEALLCLYGGSGRGVVAFARSAVEEALSAKRVEGKNLDAKIPNAKKHGILGDEEASQVHGARLSGRNALHRMQEVSQLQAMIALSATVFLLNHIAEQEPVPASQLETDSNGA